MVLKKLLLHLHQKEKDDIDIFVPGANDEDIDLQNQLFL